MRGIYDGPSTGKRPILEGKGGSRASKSLDLPRPAGTAQATADLAADLAASHAPDGSAHLERRQATSTVPIDIPGRFNPDGSPRAAKPLKPGVAAFLRLVTPAAARPPRPQGAGSSLPADLDFAGPPGREDEVLSDASGSPPAHKDSP